MTLDPADGHPANVYGQRTLAYVGALQAATSREDILRLTIEELGWYGLTFVTSWSPNTDGTALRDSIDLNTRPADYVEHYLRNDLLWRDPVVLAMRKTLATLTWSEVKAKFSWSKAERAVIDEGRGFGANDGLTIPIFSGGLMIGAFSACGWNPDLSPDARTALQIVGMSAHQALMRTGMADARRGARHVGLTPREREVVRWVANGKSNEDIGDILGIAAGTVKTMLERAQAKLNASGRTYTVVQALRLGELDLNG